MLQGVINIPLIEDQLAVRAVAYGFDNSGFIENVAASNRGDGGLLDSALAFGGIAVDGTDIGKEEYTGFRITTLWQPTELFDVTLTYTDQDVDQTGWPEVNLALDEFQQERFLTREGMREALNNQVEIINLTANYDMKWGDITSVTSWIDYDQKSLFDLSFGFGLPIDAAGQKKVDSFIQEVRFVSDFDGPIQLLTGIYYEDRESSRDFHNSFSGEPEFEDDVLALFLPPPLPEKFENRQTLVADIKQTAFYGELVYQLSEQFVATIGGRYFEYEQDAPTTLSGIFGNSFTPNSTDDSGTTYKFNLSYRPADDVLVYGQWAEGFRLGGVQTALPPGCAVDGIATLPDGSEIVVPDNIAPDELENFELGVNSSFYDDRITINAAIYRINWEGIPVQIGLACASAIVANAGESKSEGVELESQILLTENLRMDISFSYNDATLTEDALGLGAGAIKGADLPGSADFNMSLGGEYKFLIADSEAFVRVDYAYIGEYFSDFSSSGQNSGDYGTVNLKVGATIDQFSIDVFANNLTNADDFTWTENILSQLTGASRAYQLRPRTIGLNIGYQF